MDPYKKYSYSANKSKRNRRLIFLLSLAVFFCFYQLVTKYLIASYRIQSESMLPELSSGNMIFVTPLYSSASVKRGDLVLISSEGAEDKGFFKNTLTEICAFFTFRLYRPLESGISSEYYVRRIAALPGDSVYMKDFILHVKPKNSEHFLTEFELTERDYNIKTDGLAENWSHELPFSGHMQEIKLAENQYFVLCDNRIISNDSRLMGVLNGKTGIKGKVLLRYFPFSKISIF